MAVVPANRAKIEPSQLADSVTSSPPATRAGSDAGSEASSVGIAGNGDHTDHSVKSGHLVNSRRDVEIQNPASSRSEEYRQLFHLPPDEVLLQDFNCALQESILLQGHMYLFVHHICFYSNIFGFETKKAIPLEEIECVRKAKTAAIFPNAIEIVAGGKKYFFASFLSRDEAYRLIVDGWSQHSYGAKASVCQQDSKSESGSQENRIVIFENSKSFRQPVNEVNSMDRNEEADILEERKLLANGEDKISVSTTLPKAQENGEDVKPVISAETSSSIAPFVWKLEDADAPKIPKYYTMVAQSKFQIEVEKFFNLFFSDDAVDFIESFHRGCGDKDFRCSSWYQHEQFGYARDVSFQHPIKISFGARFGNCQEVQKFRAYRGRHLVIETSQEINDVPYGDYFRVEGLWDVQRDGEAEKACTLRIYVNVAFSKKTIWKGKIEQSTVEECREAYSIWMKNAFDFLKQNNLEETEEGKSTSNMIQNVDVQLEGHEKANQPSERLNQSRNLTSVPQQESNYEDAQLVSIPLKGNFCDTSSITSVSREKLVNLCSYLKSQGSLSPVVVITFIVILLMMQLSIVLLLSRAPQVHLVPQVDYMSAIGSCEADRVAALSWFERRVHHLKDEMFTVEARLEKMRQEHLLLQEHIRELAQIKIRKQ